MRRAQVIGAGLAGLGAAVALTQAGFAVTLSEAAAQAGGRCRSYHDPQLGQVIDNGNHLVLSGNTAVMDYLRVIGASDRLAGPDAAVFDFADVRDGARWQVRPNDGAIPWWITVPSRRVPGTRIADYLPLRHLLTAANGARLTGTLPMRGALWDRLLEPMLVSALNTPTATASATLAGAIVRDTLAKGGRAYRPRVAEPTLSAAFIDPALDWLRARGATVRTGRRLRGLRFDGARVVGLEFSDGEQAVAAGESVILAVPPWVAAPLVPGLTVPDQFHAIVNAHFLVAPPPGAASIVGVVGGTTEWIFAFHDRLSVTVSAADRLLTEDREALARRLWAEVAQVHGLDAALPPWQIVREKRATFAATPAQDARRPGAATDWANLWLAGDWTQTGLPATIEGALRSGATAAETAGRWDAG